MELTELQQMQRKVNIQRTVIKNLRSHIQKLKEELDIYYELPVSRAVKNVLKDDREHDVIYFFYYKIYFFGHTNKSFYFNRNISVISFRLSQDTEAKKKTEKGSRQAFSAEYVEVNAILTVYNALI